MHAQMTDVVITDVCSSLCLCPVYECLDCVPSHGYVFYQTQVCQTSTSGPLQRKHQIVVSSPILDSAYCCIITQLQTTSTTDVVVA